MNRNPLLFLSAIIAILFSMPFPLAASTTTDKVFADEIWMVKGEQQTVGLQLTNHSLYTALQCDIVLPEGLLFADNQSSGIVTLSVANRQTHLVETSSLSNGALRVVIMSMSNSALTGSNPIANFEVQAAGDVVGQKTIEIQNVRIVSVRNRAEYTVENTQTTVNVLEARTVITAKDYTRKYGEDNPVFEYTVEGPAIVGMPEITCSTTAASAVGTYGIVVKQGTIKNTCVVLKNGKLTVEKAPLSIAAGKYSKKQGEAMPEFTLTYSGFKNNETEDVLTKKPTATTTATVDSEPGEYIVTVSGGEARNYSFTYVDGKLIVTPSTAIDVIRMVSHAELYDLQGNKIGDYNNMPTNLPAGIYLLRKNGKTMKISIK